MKGIQHTLLSYAAAAVFLLALWWAIALLLALPIVPTPDKVLVRLAHVFSRDIFAHAAWSLWRIAAGLSLAVCIGYPLGVLMGYFRRADRYLSPVVYLTYPLSKILMIFLIIVFQVIVAVRDAIRTLPEERYAPLYSLGASFAQVFRFVILPASLPKFITAVRVAMATAVSVLFFTETFGTQYGMGYYIMDAWLRVNYLEMYAGILVLSAMGLLLFGLIDGFERAACRWQRK